MTNFIKTGVPIIVGVIGILTILYFAFAFIQKQRRNHSETSRNKKYAGHKKHGFYEVNGIKTQIIENAEKYFQKIETVPSSEPLKNPFVAELKNFLLKGVYDDEKIKENLKLFKETKLNSFDLNEKEREKNFDKIRQNYFLQHYLKYVFLIYVFQYIENKKTNKNFVQQGMNRIHFKDELKDKGYVFLLSKTYRTEDGNVFDDGNYDEGAKEEIINIGQADLNKLNPREIFQRIHVIWNFLLAIVQPILSPTQVTNMENSDIVTLFEPKKILVCDTQSPSFVVFVAIFILYKNLLKNEETTKMNGANYLLLLQAHILSLEDIKNKVDATFLALIFDNLPVDDFTDHDQFKKALEIFETQKFTVKTIKEGFKGFGKTYFY